MKTVLILTLGIWLLVWIISMIAALKSAQYRHAVNELGELIELDEHEDALAW
ncbi:MAG: hypothetical protein ACTHMC_09700 [Pseudobacter sp.]|uniref:hypothetical protein n=1 Tax=Pseudobacter sp. TaxID=2045420 RepID=UPI003F7FE503